MDGRQIKGYMGLLFIGEGDQLPLNVVIIKKGELIFTHGHALIKTRIFIQGIIIA